MALVVLDGYNVLLSTGRGADEAARAELCREAAAYRGDRGVDVLIVFDSRDGGRPGTALAHPGVQVAFARGDADAAILELVRRSRSPRDVRVFTSDRRLAAAVRDLGARTEDVASFRRRAAAPRRRSSGSRPVLAHAPLLPKKEVEEWLRIFGERETDPDDT